MIDDVEWSRGVLEIYRFSVGLSQWSGMKWMGRD